MLQVGDRVYDTMSGRFARIDGVLVDSFLWDWRMYQITTRTGVSTTRYGANLRFVMRCVK